MGFDEVQLEDKSEIEGESDGESEVAGEEGVETHPPLPLPLRRLRIPSPVFPSRSLPPTLNPSQSATLPPPHSLSFVRASAARAALQACSRLARRRSRRRRRRSGRG